MIYFLLLLFVLLLAVFLYYQNNKLDITRYKIRSADIDSKVKIVHLSDFHSKVINKLPATVKRLNPDIIVITGDYINDKGKNEDKMLAFGRQLTEIATVVYITGNHERRLDNFEEIMDKLSGIGFTVLLDGITQTETEGGLVTFLGLDENQADFEDYKARKEGRFEYKDVAPLFRQFEKKKGFKIVLSHFPENFEQIKEMNYAQYDFDLQLSGHAHGGQFVLPFIGPVFSPGQGIFPKYAKGSYGTRPMLIVSRGLGNAEFPFRLFNHPEINVITLTRKLSED